jgi:hypothetical protein
MSRSATAVMARRCPNHTLAQTRFEIREAARHVARHHIRRYSGGV